MDSSTIIQRVWSYCNVLRDDGMSYGDYLEQLTYLLFLKMADETRTSAKQNAIPKRYNWQSLVRLDGEALEKQYNKILKNLGKGAGLVPTIFRKAQNRIQDPAKLKRLIFLIDGETWTGLDIDVKSTIYEGLLEKNAQDVKGGAGQYFTPRELIHGIVDVMRPEPKQTIADPACGTGGFLIAAYDYIAREYKPLDRDQLKHLRQKALFGWEIVNGTARMCMMNLYLHGIGANGDEIPIHVADSLKSHPGKYFDLVMTNPPFGKKSSVTYVTDEGDTKRESQTIVRDDFWAPTSNKQLNFLQHVHTILNQNGKAAVIVPDNVLFEGGAGTTIRSKLLETCDVHTLLRLPTGIFYAQGVKANVLFFDRKPASAKPWTDKLWIFDMRTNRNFTLKQNTLVREDLDEFVKCFNAANLHKRKATWSEDHPEGRWRAYTYDELLARDKVNLDIFWLRDENATNTDNLPRPGVIAAEIAKDLRVALEQFEEIESDVNSSHSF
jgi:type I restriction enzyme M protein